MQLDKLMTNLEIQVEPFALCDIRRGGRLRLAPPGSITLHFFLRGDGSLRVGRNKVEVRQHALVICPATMAHAIEAGAPVTHEVSAAACHLIAPGLEQIIVGKGELGLLMVCGRITATYGGVAGIFDRVTKPLVVYFDDDPVVRNIFSMLLAEQSGGQPGCTYMTTALMHQCFILLMRRLSEQQSEALPWLAAIEHPQLGRALDAILDKPAQPHTVESLAEVAAMSRSSFSQKFKAAFGRPPMDLVREARLRSGAALLRKSDLPIKSIASRVGFQSRTHFSTAFSAHFGIAPRAFRDAHSP